MSTNEKTKRENLNEPLLTHRALTINQSIVSIPGLAKSLPEDYQNYRRIGLSLINDKHFDVYEVFTANDKYLYYENIEACFGKGELMPGMWAWDIPQQGKPIKLSTFLGSYFEELQETGLKNDTDLSSISIHFKWYASMMVSNHIATYDRQNNEILVTPVKYHTILGYPILHSYNLYKLFVLHQAVHLSDGHRAKDTETTSRGNFYKPKMGIDCIAFEPRNHEARSFETEFIDFTLWTHKPNAFENALERKAFAKSAQWGIDSNMFTLSKLISTILLAEPPQQVTFHLISALKGNF